MSIYNVTFMARQELSPQQVEELTTHLGKVITDQDGKILKTEQWGLKTLAYKINKSKKAHYTMIEIECEAAALHEMERQMGIHDDVMRHLTLRLDEASTEPSPMVKTYERSESKEAA